MKSKLLACTLAAAFATTVAGSAQALMVAGWDFSQYLGDGILSVDGATFTTTLSSNYSNLDPTFNAGLESAAFGMMYINGQFGSTNVDPESVGLPEWVPSANSLSSNINGPVTGPGTNPFESDTILIDEGGQIFANLLKMAATANVSVVFQATLFPVGGVGTDWSLSFGGQTSAGTQSVGIEFSTDGLVFASVGSVELTTLDTPYTVPLGTAFSPNAWVRLNFSGPTPSNQAWIDNLGISATVVPEPGTAVLLLAGLAGLHRYGRRRA